MGHPHPLLLLPPPRAQMPPSLLRLPLLLLLLLLTLGAHAFSCLNDYGFRSDTCYDSNPNMKTAENPTGGRYQIYYFSPETD